MKPKDWILELSMPAVMTALAIYVLRESYTFKQKAVGEFPRIIAYVMLVGVVVTLIEMFLNKKKSVNFSGKKVYKALLLVAMLVVYALIIPKVGYMIPSLVLCAAIMVILNYKNPVVIAVSSVLAVAVIFVLFKLVLKVPLPMLWLDI